MEEDIQNYSRTKMFRGTPCIGFNRYYYYETSVCAKTQFLYYFFWLRTNYVTKKPIYKNQKYQDFGRRYLFSVFRLSMKILHIFTL